MKVGDDTHERAIQSSSSRVENPSSARLLPPSGVAASLPS
jgi:hypothetical protein